MQEASSMLVLPVWMCRRVGGAMLALACLSGCNQSAPTVDAPDDSPSKRAETTAPPLAADAEDFISKIEQTRDTEPARPEVRWTAPLGTVNERGEQSSPRPVAVAAPPPTEPPAPVVQPPAPAAKIEPPKPIDPATLSADQLLAGLRHHLGKDRAAALKPYLAAAALSVIDPTAELTEPDLSALSPEDRQLVLAYQRTFTQLGRSLRGSSDADRRELRLAAEELASQTAEPGRLRIANAHLCMRVDGFGQYAPFPNNTFLAGREQPAIVYAELSGFTARHDPSDQHYDVKLTQKIVLYNESDGLAVWQVKPTEIVDRSRNPRRDFFLVQIVNLPGRLSVGKYLLKLTITDEHGQAVDEATIPMNVVADAKLAQSPAR
jgi:hypothetical protein